MNLTSISLFFSLKSHCFYSSVVNLIFKICLAFFLYCEKLLGRWFSAESAVSDRGLYVHTTSNISALKNIMFFFILHRTLTPCADCSVLIVLSLIEVCMYTQLELFSSEGSNFFPCLKCLYLSDIHFT